MYVLYILRTSSNTLYIGQTNNLKKRLQEHKTKSGKSAKYIRYFRSFKLVYTESFSSRRDAMRREYKLKQWTHAKKETLIWIHKKTMTFCDRVYKIVATIPKGKVATYGQIARLAGNPKAARAVGMCMKTNLFAPRVPCHRVIGNDGSLVGFSGGKGISTKKSMLRKEGVRFIKDKVDIVRFQYRKFPRHA